MRNNPIAFRPTDENKKYLATKPDGQKSKIVNSALILWIRCTKEYFGSDIDAIVASLEDGFGINPKHKSPLTHPRQVKK